MKKIYIIILGALFLLSSCDSQYIISDNLSLKLPFLGENDIYLSYECLNKTEFIFSLPLKFNEKFKDTDIDKIELFDKNNLINSQTLKVENISNNNFILKIKVLGNTDHIDHAKVYLKNNKAYLLPLDISWIKKIVKIVTIHLSYLVMFNLKFQKIHQ